MKHSVPGTFAVIGTKPARPHRLCNQVRSEIMQGPGGEISIGIRMRDELAGALVLCDVDSARAFAQMILTSVETLEKNAADQAATLLGDLFKKGDGE